jgi:hypothetical protein
MAVCPSCNAPLKDGDWTCGACGAPVAGVELPRSEEAGTYGDAGAYGGSSGAGAYGGSGGGAYGSYGAAGPYGGEPATYQPQPAAGPDARRSSGLLKAVLVVGVLAVLAIIMVWFFALRGSATTGEEFVGSWTATSEQGIATVRIAQQGDAFSVTLSGNEPDQEVTVPAHLDGADLVITMDDFSQMAGAEKAEALKTALKALAGDFKMVFSSVDATHLDLRIVGTAANGDDFDQSTSLTREGTSTT